VSTSAGRERYYPKLGGSPVRADWRLEEFTQAIRDHGLNLLWQKASRCPCVNSPQTQQPLVNCPVCYGVGWEYWGDQVVRGIIDDLNLDQNTQIAFGTESHGMARITLESAHRPNFRDRLVSLTSVLPFSEKRWRKALPGELERLRYQVVTRTDLNLWPDDPKPEPVNDFPSTYVDSAGQPVSTYVDLAASAQRAQAIVETGPVEYHAPIAVTRLRTMDPVTREPNPYVLVQGVDFEVVAGRINWALGDARGTAPALDQLFSVTYNYSPVYQVVTFTHAARDQFLPGTTCDGVGEGAQKLTRFPVEVLVRLEALIEGVPGD
jgi:hypothetical protein